MADIDEARNFRQNAATDNIPDLTTMTPAKAKRAWRKLISDLEPMDGAAAASGIAVLFSLDEYELNFGKQGEEISRKNLADRLAAFRQAYMNS